MSDGFSSPAHSLAEIPKAAQNSPAMVSDSSGAQSVSILTENVSARPPEILTPDSMFSTGSVTGTSESSWPQTSPTPPPPAPPIPPPPPLDHPIRGPPRDVPRYVDFASAGSPSPIPTKPLRGDSPTDFSTETDDFDNGSNSEDGSPITSRTPVYGNDISASSIEPVFDVAKLAPHVDLDQSEIIQPAYDDENFRTITSDREFMNELADRVKETVPRGIHVSKNGRKRDHSFTGKDIVVRPCIA